MSEMKATLLLELVFCSGFKTASNPFGLRLRTGPESAARLKRIPMTNSKKSRSASAEADEKAQLTQRDHRSVASILQAPYISIYPAVVIEVRTMFVNYRWR